MIRKIRKWIIEEYMYFFCGRFEKSYKLNKILEIEFNLMEKWMNEDGYKGVGD